MRTKFRVKLASLPSVVKADGWSVEDSGVQPRNKRGGSESRSERGIVVTNDLCNGISRSSNLCIGVGGFWCHA
jgi:hypothetical protein